MVTTIQLSEGLKAKLGSMKQAANETYEEVIVRVMKRKDSLEKGNTELLKQGYEEMAATTKQMQKEWSATEKGWD